MLGTSVNQITNTQEIDSTSQAAGAASVLPGYIVSDIPQVFDSCGLDSVDIATDIVSAPATSFTAIEVEDGQNYIPSETAEGSSVTAPDSYEMNTLREVLDAFNYIDPTNSSVQALLNQLKDLGIITDGMSNDDMAIAINSYISRNFTYVTELSGDDWKTVTETIDSRSGDCEDLANLTASLIMAALISRGMSIEEASKKVCAVVLVNEQTAMGHVIVKYETSEGNTLYLDPTTSQVSYSLDGSMQVAFTYSAVAVDIFRSIDLSKLSTAGYTIPDETFSCMIVDYPRMMAERQKVCDAVAGLVGAFNTFKTEYNATKADIQATLDANPCETYSYYTEHHDIMFGSTLYHWDDTHRRDTDYTYTVNWPNMASQSTYQALINAISTAPAAQSVAQVDAMISWLDSVKTGLDTTISNYESFQDAREDKIFDDYGYIMEWIVYATFSWTSDSDLDDIRDLKGTIEAVKTQLNEYKAALAYYKSIETGFYTPSTSFMDAILSYSKSMECGIWEMTKDILKVNALASCLDADGRVSSCQATVNYWQSLINAADYYENNLADDCVSDSNKETILNNGKTAGKPYFVKVDWSGKNFDGTYDNWHALTQDQYTALSNGSYGACNWWWGDLNKVYNCVQGKKNLPAANTALNNAISARNILKAEVMSNYGIPDLATLNAMAANLTIGTNGVAGGPNAYIFPPSSANNSTIYYKVNWNNTTIIQWAMDAAFYRGILSGTTIVYEAKRDLRGLVQQELDSEVQAYKGMAVNRLFEKKTDKLAKLIKDTMSKVLDTVDNLNQSIATQEIIDINEEYDGYAQDITDDAPGTCEQDDREERTLENENDRLQEINAVNAGLEEVDNENAQGALNLLQSCGDLGDSSDIISSIDYISGNYNNIVIATTNQVDDDQYQELDLDLVESMRSRLSGAFSARRAMMMAKQAMDDARNLVHQEMTGVGGRKSRADIAAKLSEEQGEAALTWFDEMVDSLESATTLHNTIRDNERQIAQNKELLETIRDSYGYGLAGKIFSGLAALCTIISLFCPYFAIGAIIFGMIASICTSYGNSMVADEREQLEKDYKKEDMVLTEYEYDPDTETADTGDDILNLVINTENDIQDLIGDMNYANYISNVGSGDGTTSVFDTIAFASSVEDIRDKTMILFLADAARRALAEMRSLTHMEMTGVGNRESSNMTKYAIEAARGQMSFSVNRLYSYLNDRLTVSNRYHERQRNISTYEQYSNAADWGFGLSFIPILGGAAGGITTNIMDLNAQHDSAEDIMNTTWTTDETLDDATLNGLITDGFMDSGDGTSIVDFSRIMDARNAVATAFIAANVEAAIKKAMRDMRSLVHMEMTDISSSSGTDMAEQANALNFQTALQSLQMITNYLTQKAQIQNRAEEARKNEEKLDKQIATAWSGSIASCIIGIFIACIAPGAFGSFMSILSTCSLAATIINAGLAITSAINSWFNYHYANDSANGDMGEEIRAYFAARDAMASSVNSTENRIEQLEAQCLAEITEDLFQSLGRGYVGVNRGLSSQYKNMLSNLYKAEKVKSEVQNALRDLRNMVHEILCGKGGASINSALMVINMKDQKIKAQIDDSFSMLDAVANRMNQLTAAQKQVIKAKMQYMKSIVNATIQTILAAISVAMAYSKESTDIANAEIELNAEQNNAKTTPDKIDAKQANLNKANADYAKMSAKFFLPKILLEAALLLSDLAFAAVEKAALEDQEAESEAATAASGVTGGPKRSQVVAANYTMGDGLDGLVAEAQVNAGQAQVDQKMHTYELESRQINSDYRDKQAAFNKALVLENGPGWIKSVGQQIKDSSKHQAVMSKTEVANTLRSVKRFNNLPLATQKSITEALEKYAKEMGAIIDPDALVSYVQAHIARDVAVPRFQADATPQSSSAPTIAQAEQLTQAASASGTAPADNVTPQQVLANLREQLKALEAEKRALKTRETEIKADATPAARNRASLEDQLRLKREELIRERDSINETISDMRKKGDSKAVEKAIRQLKKKLVGIMAEYEVLGAMCSIARGGESERERELAGIRERLTQVDGQINNLRDLIRKAEKEQLTASVDATTRMFETASAGVRAEAPTI